ncbi:MAG: mechanosensitive ion channel domain-containing protein, partial [Planctomycetota bacterium]
VGFLLSRTISRIFGKRLFRGLGLSSAGSAALQTLMFYALLTCFTLLSLDVVNVPLTMFAFLGGAAAIGVGFGSQNLLNNFISGVILLVERPIRVGDLVNVEGTDANIEKIGARSTRVRTGENLEMLIPNSKFLENKDTNWTLSDTRIRTSVSVGVAYGSPVRQVVDMLGKAVTGHPKVMDEPAPIVLFRDFGDSSLLFETHFWIHMNRIMDGAIVESEVRVRIDELFRDAGVTISFPQRDVHLDVQSPIRVQLDRGGSAVRGERLRAA